MILMGTILSRGLIRNVVLLSPFGIYNIKRAVCLLKPIPPTATLINWKSNREIGLLIEGFCDFHLPFHT